MTFDELESSRSLAAPLELYLFNTGQKIFAYCNGDDDFTYGGVVYKAVPIERDRITASGTLDRATLTVKLADNTALAETLRGYPVSSVITLIIRQGHVDMPPPFLVAWTGRVLSARGANAGYREMACQPASTSLKRSGLRRNWQYACTHALYGAACRASRPAATVNTEAVGSLKTTVFIADGTLTSRAPLDKWQGGLVSWVDSTGSTVIRTVQRVSDLSDATTALALGGPTDLAPGTMLAISLGCNRTMEDCSTLHTPVGGSDGGTGNIHNFGGQPFIPLTNPTGISRNY